MRINEHLRKKDVSQTTFFDVVFHVAPTVLTVMVVGVVLVEDVL